MIGLNKADRVLLIFLKLMARIWEYVLTAIQKQVLFNPSYVQSFPSELKRPSTRPVLTKYQLQCLQRYFGYLFPELEILIINFQMFGTTGK